MRPGKLGMVLTGKFTPLKYSEFFIYSGSQFDVREGQKPGFFKKPGFSVPH
jgi:hypothetical protein